MSVDKLNLFLVGPLEISLKQHFRLGMCEKKCYFCTLKQPLRVHYPCPALAKHFPCLQKLVALSDDVRIMDHSPDFILVDIRRDKRNTLPRIEGIRVYEVNTEDVIETVEAKFNEAFMEARGREHFLFMLNQFSFEEEASVRSEEFHFCDKLIRILNSYSYCYLSMLEGGEASYGYFVKELRLKSELLNSRLLPVSEYREEEEQASSSVGGLPLVGRDWFLELSEIVALQQLHDRHKLSIFEGEDNSADYLLFVHEGTPLSS